MKHKRFFRVLAAAVILALLMLAIPITPALAQTISLSVVTGPPGTVITVTGLGFTPSTSATVWFDVDGDDARGAGETYKVVTTDATTGNLPAGVTLTVPTVPRDTVCEVHVDVPYDAIPDASASFTVAPGITTNVSTTTVGATITVNGKGFDGTVGVTILFDGVSVGTDTTDSYGSFDFSFSVPACPAGSHTIKAQETLTLAYFDALNITVSPKITINPTTGAVGDTITVNGNGFKASDTVAISFDGVNKTSTPSDANGTLTATSFVVPEASRGSHTVKAQDTAANYAPATFAVSASITINPTSGSSGTTVTVTGTGFAASQTITITYDGTAVTTTPSPITTNAAGYFTATFSVPVGEAGTYVVSVSDGTSTITANFESTTSATISQTTTATAPGNVGMSITISGVGFLPSHTITITYESTPVVFTTTSLADGSFSYPLTIPASDSGEHTITVTDGLNSRTFDFFMEDSPPPTPTLVLPLAGEKAESEAVFDWSTVQDVSPASNPVTYELQVATSESFSSTSIFFFYYWV